MYANISCTVFITRQILLESKLLKEESGEWTYCHMKGKQMLLVFTGIKLTITITTPVKSVNMVNNKNDIVSIFNIFHHDNYMLT